MAHDTIRLENEVKRLRAIIRDGVPDQGSDCPECGFMVPVDEDGLCISCGRDVMWYHPAIYNAKALKADNTRLRASLAAAAEWNVLLRAALYDAAHAAYEEIRESCGQVMAQAVYHAVKSVARTADAALDTTFPKQDSEEVCPDCGGKGVVHRVTSYKDLGVAPQPGEPCPACKGTGKRQPVHPDTEEE